MNTGTMTCKGCGAAIVWGTTDAGKKMPLDDRLLTVFVEATLTDGKVVIQPLRGRTSHFASCSQAEQFRKQREAKGRKAVAEEPGTNGGGHAE